MPIDQGKLMWGIIAILVAISFIGRWMKGLKGKHQIDPLNASRVTAHAIEGLRAVRTSPHIFLLPFTISVLNSLLQLPWKLYSVHRLHHYAALNGIPIPTIDWPPMEVLIKFHLLPWLGSAAASAALQLDISFINQFSGLLTVLLFGTSVLAYPWVRRQILSAPGEDEPKAKFLKLWGLACLCFISGLAISVILTYLWTASLGILLPLFLELLVFACLLVPATFLQALFILSTHQVMLQGKVNWPESVSKSFRVFMPLFLYNLCWLSIHKIMVSMGFHAGIKLVWHILTLPASFFIVLYNQNLSIALRRQFHFLVRHLPSYILLISVGYGVVFISNFANIVRSEIFPYGTYPSTLFDFIWTSLSVLLLTAFYAAFLGWFVATEKD